MYSSMISGLSGLGPIKDISPATILKSWGSSSIRTALIIFPIHVILSSCFCASLACPSASAFTLMDLNLMILNLLLLIVSLTCLYNTGPPSVIFIRMAVISIIGEVRIIRTIAQKRSINLLMHLCSKLRGYSLVKRIGVSKK